MKITPIERPYSYSALEPFLSRETLEYHFDRHYRGYLRKLTDAIENTPYADMNLTEIVCTATGEPFFNDAAQAWNHEFYFYCMTPDPKDEPNGTLAAAISRDFGSFDEMCAEFRERASGLFGSGWAWLVLDDKHGLEIMTTENAGTPLTSGLTPLLSCDVWEHAYYIDYRNKRVNYVDAFMKTVDWDFVAANYSVVGHARAA